MEYEWLVEHRKTEADYWWFVNKRRIVDQLLNTVARPPGVLLECGCGGGYYSAQLQRAGWQVIATDIYAEAAGYAKAQGATHGLAFDGGQSWPLQDASVDALIMLDVLEHIEDDTAALREAQRVLRPGGAAIISVPAYNFLFSPWDTYNRHYRRYTARGLARVARAAGLVVERAGYWNAISLPPAMLLRLKARAAGAELSGVEYPKVPDTVNTILIRYGRVEAAWLRAMRVPCGLSAFAVIRKQA